MSNGNEPTTAISWPGKGWTMLWSNGGFDNFQLDIVGFLAVLGEGAVLANYQVSALSPLFFLPRIIPAPQALLPPTRPRDLPSVPASVTGVHSGNTKDRVYHVASILLGKELDPFEVRCVQVEKVEKPKQPPLRRAVTSMLSRLNRSGTDSQPQVTATIKGPLSWVIMLGCSLSIGLFIISIVFGDGMSLLATILLSFLSTLTGIANKWTLKLPKRAGDEAPAGDTVIRYPNGSYLVVRCHEDIARELYFAPEEIKYKIANPAAYRMISLCGTIILMLGIIALANAKLQLQIAWAAAYVIINAAHWIVAALPHRYHWDLDCYSVLEEGVEGGPENSSFTDALWKAILITKDIRWVKNGHAAPQTAVWDDWLDDAQEQAQKVGSTTGLVFNVKYGEGPSTKSTIWMKPAVYDAKTAWNAFNKAHEARKPVPQGVTAQGAANSTGSFPAVPGAQQPQ